ncbi:dihydrofolate reductase-like domain-containing protein, partial [Massariosphaeria phaeospora]
LILAATPSLGIGQAGTLPWPQLKKEMAYFARVTKRVPARPSTSASTSAPGSAGIQRVNAVVMGRRTWDSIPERFRPLKGRLNVVVTRDGGARRGVEGGSGESAPSPSPSPTSPNAAGQQRPQIERVFVIGGASIYKAALALPQTNRVLLTKIAREYECDTVFPVDLDGEEGEWKRVGRERLEEFVG